MPSPKIGLDVTTGLTHFNSGAKRTYIWPMCSTSHLSLQPTLIRDVVTCLACWAAYFEYYAEFGMGVE